jgi:hypothetical protein
MLYLAKVIIMLEGPGFRDNLRDMLCLKSTFKRDTLIPCAPQTVAAGHQTRLDIGMNAIHAILR